MTRYECALISVVATVGLLTGGGLAHADVTVQQQTTFDMTFIKAHGTTTELTSGDKQRRDVTMGCEGLMSLVCKKADSGEITRLDKDAIWILDPKDKEYRETHLPTPAERQAAEEQLRATMEKLKQCPAAKQPGTSGPDTSKCQMSPAKLEAHQTDKHATIAGHDARLSQMTLTQSCHNPDTGDTCDFLISFDSWLTQDDIAGLGDRKAFTEAYLKKLGLLDGSSQQVQMQQQMQQFLAPYRDSLKDLSAKAAEFKGFPMKTAIRISFGGAQCAAAKNANASGSGAGGSTVGDASSAAGQAAASSSAGAATSAASSAASSAAGNGVTGGILGSAASAFTSKLASGLFAKKAATPASPATAAASDVPPNMIQVAQVTVETTSITSTPIPADQFEVPAGWKLMTAPKAKAEKEFSCPASGT
jgi:hypothetical protein